MPAKADIKPIEAKTKKVTCFTRYLKAPQLQRCLNGVNVAAEPGLGENEIVITRTTATITVQGRPR